MWTLLRIERVTPRPDGTILVSFIVTDGQERQSANMGLDGRTTPEQIDAAIAEYLVGLNTIPETPPDESSLSQRLDELDAILDVAAADISKARRHIAFIRESER